MPRKLKYIYHKSMRAVKLELKGVLEVSFVWYIVCWWTAINIWVFRLSSSKDLVFFFCVDKKEIRRICVLTRNVIVGCKITKGIFIIFHSRSSLFFCWRTSNCFSHVTVIFAYLNDLFYVTNLLNFGIFFFHSLPLQILVYAYEPYRLW